MRALLIAAMSICFASHSQADDTVSVSLTSNEEADVRAKLQAFQDGTATLDQLTIDGGAKLRSELIAYYLQHTNETTVKMDLPISRCFAASDQFTEAAALAGDYVRVYTNDWHGWRILGGANFILTNYPASVAAYTNAVRLGDKESYAPLAAAALKADRLDIVQDILPQLFTLKQAKQDDARDVILVLLIYSLRTNQQDIFSKALDGVSAREIISDGELYNLVRVGCNRFKGQDIDSIRKKFERQ